MPQIWMTYEEAGELLGCTQGEARDEAIRQGWTRKRSQDGMSRLKLTEAQTSLYITRLTAERIRQMQTAVPEVRTLQERVSEFSDSGKSRAA